MIPSQPSPQINPLQQLQAAAAAGNPQAIQQLQAMQQSRQGPPGAPPGTGAPGMSPPGMGMAPPPQQGFTGASVPPDIQAQRANQLIQILRSRQA